LNGPAPHVVEEDIVRLIEDTINPEMQGCGSILIDEREDFEIRDLRSSQESMALVLSEGGRDGNHTVFDRRSDVLLGHIFDVSHHHGQEFLWSIGGIASCEAKKRGGLVVEEFVREILLRELGHTRIGCRLPNHPKELGKDNFRFASHESVGI
jgi:hypothetical protein